MGVVSMKATTVFKNGPSTQAVRIPKEYRLKTNEVWIKKSGNMLILIPKPESWDDFFDDPATVSDDFDMTREQDMPQQRDDFFK
jgi:antitoxin VapB